MMRAPLHLAAMASTRKPSDLDVRRPIVLVGMMGAGKTTVGRRLATALDLPFCDTDTEIEKAAGMSVSDLFAAHGEASFRKGEAKVIKRLLGAPPMILATGGGALTNAQTRTLIKERSVSIWIKVDIETVLRRASRRGARPLLQTGDPRATLERLFAEREAFYAEADIHLESQPGPHENTVELIIEKLEASPWLFAEKKASSQ